MSLRLKKNLFFVFALTVGMGCLFLLTENFVYAEVFKEWSYYTNNMVWLSAITMTIGGAIYSKLERKGANKENLLSILFAISGFFIILLATLNLEVVQTLFYFINVNRINSVLPLVYLILNVVINSFILPIIMEIRKRMNGFNYRIFMAVFGGLVVILFLQIMSGKLFGYVSAFIFVGAIMVCAGITACTLRPVMEDDDDDEDEIKIKIRKFMPYAISLVFLVASFVFVQKNYRNFAEHFGFGRMNTILGFYIPLIVGLLATRGVSLLPFNQRFLAFLCNVLYCIALFGLVFCISFVGYILVNTVIVVTFCITAKCLVGLITERKKKPLSVYNLLLLFVLPATIGYMCGVWLTEGMGFMFDAFAGANLFSFRRWAEIMRGIVPMDSGYFPYIGLGSVKKFGARRLIIPSFWVMRIGGFVGVIPAVILLAEKIFCRKKEED